ncbi:MAG TPA: asparaginase [Candidatus Limnocylindrales bacterium]|nr:asparaginase [Candidatus Limnocylindrales bacterium]
MVGESDPARQPAIDDGGSASSTPKRIVVLTTGGTIATTRDPLTRRSSPTLGARIADAVDVDGIELSVEEASNVASWRLEPDDMARIAVRAAALADTPGVDGVVVTHGTTTLEYTAFLANLVVRGDIPIVLTGAMRRADDPEPDGPANLRDAVLVAAASEARGLGALVVFAGRILGGGRVWKANRSEGDAFVDLSGHDVGFIREGRVEVRDRPVRPQPFSGRLDTRVRLVKLVPGADGAGIQAAAAGDVRGLVVEALPGSGGVPPGAVDALRQAAARMPTVIASRAPFGHLPDAPTGGTGEPLAELPLLSAGSLSAEQAWLLLMLVLGETERSGEAARKRFEAVARG